MLQAAHLHAFCCTQSRNHDVAYAFSIRLAFWECPFSRSHKVGGQNAVALHFVNKTRVAGTLQRKCYYSLMYISVHFVVLESLGRCHLCTLMFWRRCAPVQVTPYHPSPQVTHLDGQWFIPCIFQSNHQWCRVSKSSLNELELDDN